MLKLALQPFMQRIAHESRLANAGRLLHLLRWGRRRGLGALLLCGSTLVCAPAFATLTDISFSAASLEIEGMRFEQVRAKLSEAKAFGLTFERMAGPGEPWLRDGLALSGELGSILKDAQSLAVTGTLQARGLEAWVSITDRDGELTVELKAADQPMTELVKWPGLPSAAGWLRSGRIDSEFSMKQGPDGGAAINWRLVIDDLGFDSPEGRYAAEGLRLESGGFWPDTDKAALALRATISGGEVLIDDFYRNFATAGLEFRADLSWNDDELDVTRVSVGDGDALSIEGRARLDWGVDGEGQGSDWSIEISRLELDFPAAYQRYLEPMAAAWTMNGLGVTGRVLWSGEWMSGDLVSGDLEIKDFSIVDIQRQRFAVTGLEARLRPGDYAFDSRLTWRGLLFGRINLGAGEAALDSEPGAIALLEPLMLDVLGGRVELATLKLTLPGSRADGAGEPDVRLRARIHDLDMAQLTAALDWPSFSGTISGEIPGVSLDDGVLGVDGEIRVDVFGGRIALQNLRMERAFGVLPSLAADVSVVDLDLEQLTQTFSFGRIAGRLDGQVNELRMLDWKPVAFDAWLGTPERQSGSNDISRKAVNRLTTIGGGPATTALTSPLMRMFGNFSYRRLGLGCRLHNNICQLRGLDDDESSVLILEGAGVPKITIRAFNRSIDWPQMVSNLLAISADNPAQVGTPPDS